MTDEFSQESLKALLLVPDGPPEAVWERAVESAFTAVAQNGGQDGGPQADPAAVAAEGADPDPAHTEDHDDDPDADGPHTYPEVPGDTSEASGWNPGNGLQDHGGGDDLDY